MTRFWLHDWLDLVCVCGDFGDETVEGLCVQSSISYRKWHTWYTLTAFEDIVAMPNVHSGWKRSSSAAGP